MITGPPGAGKSATLLALVDSLAEDDIAHAAVDADEVAWAHPPPDLDGRAEHLRAWRVAHTEAGASTLVVAETIESAAHLAAVLAALGVADHLLVRLEADPDTLRARIVAREPDGWHGLDHLLRAMEQLHVSMPALDGVHLVVDTRRSSLAEVAAHIRAARPDRLAIADNSQPASSGDRDGRATTPE